MHEREIHGFVEQSHISQKNISRLRTLASSSNTRIGNLAALVLEVAMLTPYRRRRISTLARRRRDMLTRMEQAGLILPLAAREETDPHDIDPEAAWYEWVALTQSCGE